MGFCQLHLHSHIGSRLDAIASPEDYAKRAMEMGHQSLALTDHGRLSGLWEHQEQCIANEIKPILGVEMYIQDNLEEIGDKGKRIRTKNSHIVILAKNATGYKNLLKLNYLSMKDTTHFYYSPRITTRELFENHEGLVIGTACLANPFASLLRFNKVDEAEKLFLAYASVFKDDFYAEIQINEITNTIDSLEHGQKTINVFMIDMANKYGIPIVITGDVHYLEKGHDKLQTLSIAIRDKATVGNFTFELESKNLYYHDIKDYIAFNKDFGYEYTNDDIISWCNNSTFIADKIDFIIPRRKHLYLPKLTEDDDIALIKKSKHGLMKKFNVSRYEDIPKEYRKRLKHEIEIIIRKGFSSYFLLVDDITQFSIRENIYGRIGRGSTAGSLLAYSLGIHNMDPLKYGLFFERFMSESRSPDLVLDYFEE